MRLLVMVVAVALLLTLCAVAFGFPGQQFFDHDIPELRFDPADRCEPCICLPDGEPNQPSDTYDAQDLDYDYEGDYENT